MGINAHHGCSVARGDPPMSELSEWGGNGRPPRPGPVPELGVMHSVGPLESNRDCNYTSFARHAVDDVETGYTIIIVAVLVFLLFQVPFLVFALYYIHEAIYTEDYPSLKFTLTPTEACHAPLS